MAPTDVPKKERSLSYRLHDALNVPLVGGLAIMCILGLLGLMDAHLITKIFISYIAVDTIWIVLSPSAVPRFAWAIVLHHVLTFLILLHPLRFPEHAIETCRDGIVELNTFFLIARRQLTRGSLLNRACDLMYHLTLSIRFLWQPYLIYHRCIATLARPLRNHPFTHIGSSARALLQYHSHVAWSPRLDAARLALRIVALSKT